MLFGHYAPAMALKAAAPRVPLWLLFAAVLLVDVAWSLLIFADVEHARVVPSTTSFEALDLYDMSWTHSLAASLVWSLGAGVVVLVIARERRAAVAVAAAVLSHIVLDVVVHGPDITVAGAGTAHVGLGLWRHPAASIAVELMLVAIGGALLWRAPWSATRRRPLALLIGALLISTVVSPFVPAPPTPPGVALSVIAVALVTALAAAAVDSRLLAAPQPDTAES